MPGLTMRTALEIFTNPGDLEIIIGQRGGIGKFAIGILRGPEHNFNPLLTSQPFTETLDDAVKEVEKTLQVVHEVGMRELKDPKSLFSRYLNPDGLEIDQSKVLNPDLISRIIEELRQHRVASTYKMLTSAG